VATHLRDDDMRQHSTRTRVCAVVQASRAACADCRVVCCWRCALARATVGVAEALKRQGNDAFVAKEYAKAVDFYTRALELSPSSHVRRAHTCFCGLAARCVGGCALAMMQLHNCASIWSCGWWLPCSLCSSVCVVWCACACVCVGACVCARVCVTRRCFAAVVQQSLSGVFLSRRPGGRAGGRREVHRC
jgi:hypothetical protein